MIVYTLENNCSVVLDLRSPRSLSLTGKLSCFGEYSLTRHIGCWDGDVCLFKYISYSKNKASKLCKESNRN